MYVTRLYSIHVREHAIRIIVFPNIGKHTEWWALAMVSIDLDLWERNVIALIGLFFCHAIVLLIIISADPPCWLFRAAFNHRA